MISTAIFFMFLSCPTIDGLADTNCDGRLVITCFGDSITEGAGDEYGAGGYPTRLTRYFPHATINNLGVGGETTYTGKHRANTIPNDSDHVIVLEGVNDFGKHFKTSKSSETKKNLYTILSIAAAKGARTYLVKLLRPSSYGGKKLDAWVDSVNKKIQSQIDIRLKNIHICRDGLHPSASGYEAMAKQISGILLPRRNK
jgi:lysophospholipase L1-like esterase